MLLTYCTVRISSWAMSGPDWYLSVFRRGGGDEWTWPRCLSLSLSRLFPFTAVAAVNRGIDRSHRWWWREEGVFKLFFTAWKLKRAVAVRKTHSSAISHIKKQILWLFLQWRRRIACVFVRLQSSLSGYGGMYWKSITLKLPFWAAAAWRSELKLGRNTSKEIIFGSCWSASCSFTSTRISVCVCVSLWMHINTVALPPILISLPDITEIVVQHRHPYCFPQTKHTLISLSLSLYFPPPLIL